MVQKRRQKDRCKREDQYTTSANESQKKRKKKRKGENINMPHQACKTKERVNMPII